MLNIRQNLSIGRFGTLEIVLGVALLGLVAGTSFYLANDPLPPPETPIESTGVPFAEPRYETPRLSDTAPVLRQSEDAAIPPPPAAPVPETPLPQLEAEFRGARAAERRVELISEIAGRNDHQAALILGRLFKVEADPEVKVALLAGIHEVDPATAGEARAEMIRLALQKQPRSVRLAALDLLDPSIDARAEGMLRNVAARDPDREVRDTATALLQAHAESSP